MSAIVLDSGALIALEANQRAMWAVMKGAASTNARILVPTTALAQVWRAKQSQALLGRALALCVLAPFDPVARAVGELCARSGTSDVVDAHVALVAISHADAVYTSDPKDMKRLISAHGGARPAVIPC